MLNKMKKELWKLVTIWKNYGLCGKKCSIHLRSKGKGQELRKTLSVLLKHIGKIEKERKKEKE